MTYQGQAVGHSSCWTADDLCQQLTLFKPKELILVVQGSVNAEQIQKTLSVSARVKQIQTIGSFSNHASNQEYLRKVYSIKSMLPAYEYLGLAATTATATIATNHVYALLFLLQQVEEHMPSAACGFQRNNPWIPEQSLICGNHAVSQLQMDAVTNLFSSCTTPMGKRGIHHRLLRPLTDASMIERRLAEVEEFQETPHQQTILRHLRFIGDLPRLHRKLLLVTIQPAEFVILDQSYKAVLSLASLLASPLESQITSYQSLFHTHIDSEKAIRTSQDSSPFKSSQYPEVAAIEKNIQETLQAFEDHRLQISTAASLSVDVLKLEEREKEPFGIRVSATTLAALKRLAPAHMTFTTLKSGGWIDTPTLRSLNSQLLRRRDSLVTAVRAAHLTACAALSQDPMLWTAMEEWITHLDCTFCIARVSKTHGFVRPTVDSTEGDAFVDIGSLRHPLVEQTGSRVAYVKHDVQLGLDGSNSWLVYGMNASGKSTLMKAVGISVLLAQAGCFVPAKSMTFRPFRAVYTRILNQDNLFAGLSSFAVEMSELRDILRTADANTLVLGDELCSGTESVSAMSLVAAGIEWLSAKKTKFIFATHLHDLPKLLKPAAIGLKIWHLHVEYDPVTRALVYDRTLMPGNGSTLYGLEVARAMDLPPEFLEIAATHRRALTGAVTQEDAKGSSWNSVITRRSCELCGTVAASDLEVHHIRPRASAKNSILEDGTPMNHPSNLVVLCEACHDKEHTEGSVVTELVQTSTGPSRRTTDSTSTSATKRSKWSEEELATIHRILKEFKNVSMKTLSNMLKQDYSISISAATLNKML
jgi:DNA mismatch repair protein MutS